MNTALIVFIILSILVLRPLVRIGWPVVKMIWRVRKAMKQGPLAAGQPYGPQAGSPNTAAQGKAKPSPQPSRHDYIDFEEVR